MTKLSPPQRIGITILGSGSRGNAIVVHTESQGILIDAGFSARELDRRLQQVGIDPAMLAAILVSHEHTDHVRGLRVFAGRLGLPIYANRGTAAVLRHRDARLGQFTIFAAGNPFHVQPFTIHPFSIPHDANDPVAFVIELGDQRIGVATDLGHVNHLIAHQLRQCDGLVLEANHDLTMLGNSNRPWSLKQRIMSRHGHLSNEACVQLLQTVIDARTRHVFMAHASAECNCYDLVARTVADGLLTIGRNDIDTHIAVQDTPLPTVWI